GAAQAADGEDDRVERAGEDQRASERENTERERVQAALAPAPTPEERDADEVVRVREEDGREKGVDVGEQRQREDHGEAEHLSPERPSCAGERERGGDEPPRGVQREREQDERDA